MADIIPPLMSAEELKNAMNKIAATVPGARMSYSPPGNLTADVMRIIEENAMANEEISFEESCDEEDISVEELDPAS